MSIVGDLTVLILTYNEEDNIARTLGMLTWARRILVIDSGSTDGTRDLLACYPQVEQVQRSFDTFAGQCNFGLSLVCTPWVLSIDADYEVSDAFVQEIRSLDSASSVSGYRAGFVYRVFGHPLRGALYPPRTVLYRHGSARYRDEGHGHRVEIDGKVTDLKSKIYHDDRKPLSRWVASQRNYAVREADFLLTAPLNQLRRTHRIRRMAWPAPLLVFIYTLIAKRCILDGWPGWYYVMQRTLAETMIALEIVDRRLRARDKNGHNDGGA